MCVAKGYDARVGVPQNSSVFPSRGVGCYYGPIPVMTGATLRGPSRRFELRVLVDPK